jgi:hypothetical protein
MPEYLRLVGVLPGRSFPRLVLGFSPASFEGNDEEKQT